MNRSNTTVLTSLLATAATLTLLPTATTTLAQGGRQVPPTPQPAPPGAQPAAQPAAPVTRPVDPSREPTQEPVNEPDEPATEPTPEPAPVDEPAAAPSQEPSAEPAAEPAASPAEEPSAEPADEPGMDEGATEEPAEPAAAVEQPPAASTGDGSSDPADAPLRIFRADRRADPRTDMVLVNCTDVQLMQLLPFIMETTGKTVIPKLASVKQQTITIMSDRKVTRAEALEMIFQALRLNGVAVVETEDLIMIDALGDENIRSLQPGLILGPDKDVTTMADSGQVLTKVFRVQNTKAQSIFDRIQGGLPTYAKADFDNNSNQIIVEADVGTIKRCAKLIALLDVPTYQDVVTQTFRLQYADAQTIATAITDIFSNTRPSGGGARAGAAQRTPGRGGAPAQGNAGGEQIAGTTDNLLLTVLPATNSITIRAEPDIIKSIGDLISGVWDVNPQAGGSLFRVYDLAYTDPLKMEQLLQSLLENGGSAGGGRTGGAQVRLGGNVGGGDSGATVAVSNIFKIDAYPDSNRLVIISKTPDNFTWLDQMVKLLDQPLKVGIPTNVPLKYANSVKMAEILNALLAQAGSGAEITREDTGLSGINFESAGGGTSETGGATGGQTGGQNTVQFPWQSGRGAGGDEQAEVSALVGKSRVVPNEVQNSLLVLAPPEIQQALMGIITELDKPGRQVMISSVLAEVEIGDDFAMGIKFGPNGQVAPRNPNNAVSIGTEVAGSRDTDFPAEFNEFTFDFGVDATVVLQSLAQDTAVRILQQPRVVTTDNKEAKFFSGQDVPFQSGTTSDAAGTTASFEQIAVGIGLNVRPRVTNEKNVAMEIEVLLSNVNIAAAGVGDNPTIDRRQTNTAVTVKNGQTIVLSGIRIESETKDDTGFPILKDIPGLGFIFGNVDNSKAQRELLIFVTPIVIENPDDFDTNYNVKELERLKELEKPLPSNTKKLLDSPDGRRLPSGELMTPDAPTPPKNP
ncbi:MAG: secretin N-terminal domain-containing protein [Phycisphaerales bacterium]